MDVTKICDMLNESMAEHPILMMNIINTYWLAGTTPPQSLDVFCLNDNLLFANPMSFLNSCLSASGSKWRIKNTTVNERVVFIPVHVSEAYNEEVSSS